MSNTHSPPQHVFIHRHCMQQLIHQAIKQDCCHGLLTGCGNIIENKLASLANISPDSDASPNNSKLMGAYQISDHNGLIDRQKTLELRDILNRCQSPHYYLILYLDHKGRVDAHMYGDAEFNTAITLNMLEDGDLYPPVAKR